MIVKKHGYPLDSEGQRCGLEHNAFAIIGYGKVGGIEMGYGSDLDVVFIHNMDERSDTDGIKPISGFEFAMRVARKFVSLMTTQTLDGRVYDVDTRLRPSGDAGLLVTSLRTLSNINSKARGYGSIRLWYVRAVLQESNSYVTSLKCCVVRF